MQRIFIIHGWGGSPDSDWFPWAKKTLEGEGYEVYVPNMPNTDHPKIEPWVRTLRELVTEPREDDIFIGHSIGCQTILRYLEKLPAGQEVGKVVLIAPWWYLILDENEEQADADPWLKINVDFGEIKARVNRMIAVFSNNDPCVPYEKNVEFFRTHLSPEIVTKDKMGHFSAGDGVTELPFLPELIIARK